MGAQAARGRDAARDRQKVLLLDGTSATVAGCHWQTKVASKSAKRDFTKVADIDLPSTT